MAWLAGGRGWGRIDEGRVRLERGRRVSRRQRSIVGDRRAIVERPVKRNVAARTFAFGGSARTRRARGAGGTFFGFGAIHTVLARSAQIKGISPGGRRIPSIAGKYSTYANFSP